MTRLWCFWGLRIPLLLPSSLWNKLRNKTWESESKCQLYYQWSWSRGQGWLVLLSGSLKYLCLDTTADLCLSRNRAHLCIRKPFSFQGERTHQGLGHTCWLPASQIAHQMRHLSVERNEWGFMELIPALLSPKEQEKVPSLHANMRREGYFPR